MSKEDATHAEGGYKSVVASKGYAKIAVYAVEEKKFRSSNPENH